ncbi:MAG: DNA-directed RNA polymerase subunit L [Candidatus Verstraetearchaeota archaeon]|nr:DNA-directed RNA polymerase subunit L [Candidatus Verstraetearchaeota archaeon]
MVIKILKEEKDRLEIEISNEDHTIGNLLRTALLADKHVKYAGYQIVHPLTGGIRLVVQTEGGTKPREALVKALSKIETETKEFRDKFKKAL